MSYMVSTRLSRLFQGQTVLTCYSAFDIDGFARYGAGEARVIDRIAPQIKVGWDYSEKDVVRALVTSWVDIEWRSEHFQVLRAPLLDGNTVHWIVGSEPGIEAFVKAVLAFSRQRTPTTYVYSGWWNVCPSLEEAIQESRWSDLILQEDLKRSLEIHAIGFFEARSDFEKLGVPWKRGLLLTGPPGNGKTHLIRALLNRLVVPRLIVRSFGEDPDDVQEVFDKARELSPCVLVLEDLDSLIRNELLSTILNLLDGAQPLNGVLVLATTNHPEKLDPAIRNRPSRFDRVLEFGPPGARERHLLLAKLLSRASAEHRPTASQVRRLAQDTDGFSFAYIKESAISAAGAWLRDLESTTLFDAALALIPELRANMRAAVTVKSADESA